MELSCAFAGYDVSLTDSRGQTALHHAASVDNVVVLCALMDAGADVDAKDATDCTPLHMATIFRATGCISRLVGRCVTQSVGSELCPWLSLPVPVPALETMK